EDALVDPGPARHLAEQHDLDARLLHVDDEVGDAGVLGLVGIGAGDEHRQVGDLAPGGPHLLAVHNPLLAVLFGTALQPGEIGPGAGLAEQLAPAALPGDDVAEVALLL